MPFKSIIRKAIQSFTKLKEWAEEEPKKTIYPDTGTEETEKTEVYRLWDYFQPKENTQTFHLVGIIGFDEWVDMEEIRRRIKELFRIEYKNERSLYPYIKTLVDLGLLETSSVGGRRKWRKRELLFKIEKKKEKSKKKQIAVS